MFKVLAYADYQKNKPVVIHEPQKYGNKLLSGVIEEELNAVALFEFKLTINNSYFRQFEELRSYVTVIDERTNQVKFTGRVQKSTVTMVANGQLSQNVTVENQLAYLHDTTQEYLKTSLLSVREYLQQIINTHNRQCEPYKRFILRRVTVNTNSERIYRSIGYDKTSATIKDKLLDRLGGYLVFEEVAGRLYLDYLASYGRQSQTPIQVSQNLKEASKEVIPDDLASVIVPLGAEVEESDPQVESKEHDFSKERVTIRSVNQGSLSISDPALVKRFGHIRKEVIFPDAKTPSHILNQGRRYLRLQRMLLIAWGVTVIELGLIDPRYEIFAVGNYHQVYHQLLSPQETLQIIAKKTDVINPQKTELKIGDRKHRFSHDQNHLKLVSQKNSLSQDRLQESLNRVYERTEDSHNRQLEEELAVLNQRLLALERNE